MPNPRAYIGTSGWNYRSWKDGFYQGIPQRDWLRHCASRFSAVEINATFYRLQSAESFRRWKDQAPRDFRFAMKGSRFMTHNKRLKDLERSLQLLRERAEAMGNMLQAVVWQLPANFKRDHERLGGFVGVLEGWTEVQHAMEFRHRSWFTDDVAAMLDDAGIGICQSDAADWPCWDAVAGPLVYCRLHGHSRTYASAYSKRALDRWAGKARRWLSEGLDVHVYFDNDAEGAAPHDALALIERLQ
jgi:uncharacterized protein YecE (DUF72 family)